MDDLLAALTAHAVHAGKQQEGDWNTCTIS